MCLIVLGMPLSLITMVTWCKASGSSVQKSQLLSALLKFVLGSLFTAWFRSGNFMGSRKRKLGYYCLPGPSCLAWYKISLQTHGYPFQHRQLHVLLLLLRNVQTFLFFTNFRENIRHGIFCNIMGNGKCSKCTGSFACILLSGITSLSK